MVTSNGTHGPTGHEADQELDALYSFWPAPSQPASQPCPEALFSLTLKGKLDGIDTLLTVRGQSAAEFKANLAQVRGLLDQPQPAASQPPQSGPTPQDKGWCKSHNVQMQWNEGKDGRKGWHSHRIENGWCHGKPGR
jgi:hypothetical protein